MSQCHFVRSNGRSVRGNNSRTLRRACAATLESLEGRRLLAATVSFTEFLPAQKSGIPVSATDLINGLVPAPSETNYIRSFEGGPIDNLTDGRTAANPANLDEFSAQQNAVFSLDAGTGGPPHGAFWYATYRLPLGAAPAGYDITQVDSITGHQDNRSDQTIDVEVQFVGDDAFYSLSNNANFAFRPGQGNGAGKLTVTDDTGGPLARGVRAIRYEADQQAVFRELDVFGTVTPAPTSGPNAPTNPQATPVGSNVTVTFTDQSDNEAGFRVERATVTGGVAGAFALVGNASANNNPPPGGVGGTVSFTDTSTQIGTTYRYRITAFNAFNGGTSSSAITVDATTPTSGAGAAARFFPVARWKGNPVVTQIDPNLADNTFGDGSPHPAVPADLFSAIYSGRITPTQTGTYYFRTAVDDDGMLFLGGGNLPAQVLVSDDANPEGPIELTAGQAYDFVFLASENFGAAAFNLDWSTPGASDYTPIPTAVMTSTMTPVNAAPTAPTEGAVTSNSVTITFADNSHNEVKFQLERAPVVNNVVGTYAVVAEDVPNVTELTDRTANPNTTYSYRVRAFNFEGSAVSAAVRVTTPPRVLANGVTGAWYDAGFWGLPGRPAQTGLGVTVEPDYREEAGTLEFPDPTLDRNLNGIPVNNYSTAFTGKIVIPAGQGGEYRFISNTDDDGALFVNGQLVSYDPNGHGQRDADDAANTAGFVTPITLQPGQYNFVFLQAEQAGGAGATMKWEGPATGGAREVIPSDNLRNIADIPIAPTAGTPDTVTATSATITFAETATSELRYKIEQSTDPNFATIDRTFSAPINATSFTATNLAPNTTYYFRIRGTNLEGEGAPLVATVTTAQQNTRPSAPTNLTARPTSDRLITLRFADNSNNENEFVIQRRAGTTGAFTDVGTVGADVTTFQDQIFPAPPRGTLYTYRVVARNAEGTSDPVEITVLTGAPGGSGLSATAYANTEFTDDPENPDDTVSYVDPEIGENWSLGPPVAGIPEENFSVFWEGQIQAEKTEAYTFQIEGDDQTGVIITDAAGNELVNFDLGTGVKTSDPVNLVAGQRYNIQMRHIENTGGASAFLRWASTTTPMEVIPQVFLFPAGSVVVPAVQQVFVNGPGLTGQTSANGVAFRNLAGIDNTFGYPVPAGTNQLRSIPWNGGINQISLRFTSDVASSLAQGDLVIRGSNTPTYAVSGYSYNAATNTGVWTLATPITNDKVRLFLDDALVTNFDGEWANASAAESYPSGNGTAGGDFDFRLNVLRGDATQDGVVNALDLSFIKQRLNRTATNPGSGGAVYSVFGDLTADGSINALDLSAAKQRLNNRLPTADPASALLFSTRPISA